MGDTGGTATTPVGAILAIAGGALLGIGSFLAWAEVSGGGTSVSAKGIDGTDGYITLGAGVVALLVGVVLLRQAKRALAILAIVAGLVGGGVAVYDALTAKDSVLDSAAEELAPTVGASPEQVRVLLDEAIDAGQLSIGLSIGIYVVIAGGVLALLGGIMSRGSGVGEGEAVAAEEAPQPAPSPTYEEPSASAPPAPSSEAAFPAAPAAPATPATDDTSP
ncbi:MAG TPA: hypothetical protein VJ913_11475 [Actinomycetota bacterium]|nr:hypothetical protein [Actinomycetota bacterium]